MCFTCIDFGTLNTNMVMERLEYLQFPRKINERELPMPKHYSHDAVCPD
jgi:hypothetical protein